MKRITVVVNVKTETSEFRDTRLAFWDAFAKASDSNNNPFRNPEDYADELELRVKRRLPEALHRRISSAILDHRYKEDFGGRRNLAMSPGRLIVSVEGIHYGSMKVDLGIPDIDAFIELLGNNSEAFEAVFGAYLPEAFDSCLPGNTSSLEFEVDIPSDVRNYIDSSTNGKPTKEVASAKDKGAAMMTSLLQSPLILPIILVCFLWYYARQDWSRSAASHTGSFRLLSQSRRQ